MENSLKGGSTALVTLVVNDICYIANLGDSRAVYGDNGDALRITEDHTPANETERERIIENGGEIYEHMTRDGIM